MARRDVDVVVQIGGEDVLAGRLSSDDTRGMQSATFTYAAEYLARRGAYAIDPALPLSAEERYTPLTRPMFGAFSDAGPDAWGRALTDRYERLRSRREGAGARDFRELDYVLRARDDLRQGALRFRDPERGEYVTPESTVVPGLRDLPRLVDAARRVERDEAGESDFVALLRAANAVGGARPKARVVDDGGRGAIAKVPTSVDKWDVMRWEAVALQLARAAGMQVPEWSLTLIDGRAVLLVNRFDRVGDRRVGYVSAMTLVETVAGQQGSYLEIADVIEANSPHPRDDLRELWRRIAFSILISNSDDHLRNHGFLRRDGGWALSPAFDVNPDPRPGADYLATAIDFDHTEALVATLIGVAEYFRLDPADARSVLGEVAEATSEWRATAAATGLGPSAVEQMEPAFEHPQAVAARGLTGIAGP
jgi:serine/threonine-protein kinase HipA